MPRRRDRGTEPMIEDAIKTAGSIGALERLAGIIQDVDSQYAFWKPFMHLPGGKALDAGCDGLKRRIRVSASARAA